MINLYPMTAFVQFIGAFNFANVFSQIEDKFLQYFLNVENEFDVRFTETRTKISTGFEGLSKMKTLILEDGFSNEETINGLKTRFDRLLTLERRMELTVEAKVKDSFKMNFSRPIFLAFGLYATITLLGYALLEITGLNENIYTSVAAYNLMMIVYAIYFVLCEAFKHIKSLTKFRLFQPTHWSALFASLIIPALALVNWALIDNGVCYFHLSPTMLDCLICSSLFLTVAGFIIALFFTLIYYIISKKTIDRTVKKLHSMYDELIKEKQKIDDAYSMFYKSDIELS